MQRKNNKSESKEPSSTRSLLSRIFGGITSTISNVASAVSNTAIDTFFSAVSLNFKLGKAKDMIITFEQQPSLLGQHDSTGNTIFHYAGLHMNNANAIKAFITLADKSDVEIDLNKKNNEGDTPLIIAVRNNNYGVAQTLLSMQADPMIPDAKNNSPLQIAITESAKKTADQKAMGAFQDLIQLIYQYQSAPSPEEQKASFRGNRDVDLALEEKINFIDLIKNNRSKEALAIFKNLETEQIEEELKKTDKFGNTLLHWTVLGGTEDDKNLAAYLLKRSSVGADLANGAKLTPLKMAEDEKKADFISIFTDIPLRTREVNENLKETRLTKSIEGNNWDQVFKILNSAFKDAQETKSGRVFTDNEKNVLNKNLWKIAENLSKIDKGIDAGVFKKFLFDNVKGVGVKYLVLSSFDHIVQNQQKEHSKSQSEYDSKSTHDKRF